MVKRSPLSSRGTWPPALPLAQLRFLLHQVLLGLLQHLAASRMSTRCSFSVFQSPFSWPTVVSTTGPSGAGRRRTPRRNLPAQEVVAAQAGVFVQRILVRQAMPSTW
jgi:hypothetical protein